MSSSVSRKPPVGYWPELFAVLGENWNRFWFTPSSALPLGRLRIVVGLLALYYVSSFTSDLNRWFAADGLLPSQAVTSILHGDRRVSTPEQKYPTFHPSYWYFITDPAVMKVVHFAGVAVVALFAAGLFTRASGPAALVVVLSYYHRAPMLAGPLEPLLAVTLFYLCLGPCGQMLSLDAWRKARSRTLSGAASAAELPSLAANISLRLIQLQTAGLCLAMGLAQLGNERWWGGDAIWLLIARSRLRLIDLSPLGNDEYLLNLWTLSFVAVELCFGLFVWNRWARPILLWASTVAWALLSLVTGQLGWCSLMIGLNLAFIPACDKSPARRASEGRLPQ